MLLDTQVVLWALSGDGRLGGRTRDLIAQARHRYVSPITHVELTIKSMKGKLGIPRDFPDRVVSAGFTTLPFEDRHVIGLRSFEGLVQHDPFDRMLVAQASVDGLHFVTSDRALLSLEQSWIVDATQ